MSDQKKKKTSTSKVPSCRYEKVRRDRLNFMIAELSTYLPEQNPTKSLSKVDILEKVIELVKQFLEEKKKILNKSSADECLKEEIKELKMTVANLKARICTLNKILKESNISVPIDLEVSHMENFTPHLKYSVMKKVYSSKSTQTLVCQENKENKKSRDEEEKEHKNKIDNNEHTKGEKKKEVDEDESVEKLISFTRNLKPPLKESSNVLLPPPPPPPVAHQMPTQIIVVPYVSHYYPPVLPKRPAITQLTFTNRRPISSYIDFKKNYDEQQERYKKMRKRKRKIRKCICKSVLLKKTDGTLKKVLKLCGNKLCKNKTKFNSIKEQQKGMDQNEIKDKKTLNPAPTASSNQKLTAETSKASTCDKQTSMDDYATIGPQVINTALSTDKVCQDSRTDAGKIFSGCAPRVHDKVVEANCDKNESLRQESNLSERANLPAIDCAQHSRSYAFLQDKTSIDAVKQNYVPVTEGKTTGNQFYDCNNFFNPIDTQSSQCFTGNRLNHVNQNSEPYSISNVIFSSSSTLNVHQAMNKSFNSTSLNIHSGEQLSVSASTSYVSGNEKEFGNRHTEKPNDESKYAPPVLFNAFSENGLPHNNIIQNKPLSSKNILPTAEKDIGNGMILDRSFLKMDSTVDNSEKSNYVCKNSGGLILSSSIESKNEGYSETNAACSVSHHKFGTNQSRDSSNTGETYLNNSNFNNLNVISCVQTSHTADNLFNINYMDTKVQEPSFGGFHKQRNNSNKETQNTVSSDQTLTNTLHKNHTPAQNNLKREFEQNSFSESCLEKSSCFFEAHPSALHFPYVSHEKCILPQEATKIFEETKRKNSTKSKTDSYLLPPKLSQSHDISQNIFETNKENSFDFLFGKQNPQETNSDKTLLPNQNKNKKSDTLLGNITTEDAKPGLLTSTVNDKNSFLPLSCLDEMRFSFPNSEFSNDIFSLQGHVGSQNIESVSPTAAFLLTFPLVSSKNAELLTDNASIEAGNAGTPSTLLQIGNIESLSQDLFQPQQDFAFKSNIKGLFDPFYPSCISSDVGVKDGKLNNDFNADNLMKDDFTSKQTLSSSLPTSVANPWSSNLFSNVSETQRKKVSVPNVGAKNDLTQNLPKSTNQNFSFSSVSSKVTTPSFSTAQTWPLHGPDNNNESSKKKCSSTEMLEKKKPFEVKFLPNSQSSQPQENNSKGSQTVFTYAYSSEIKTENNNSKSLVNWMTSSDGPEVNANVTVKNQEEKKMKISSQSASSKLPFISMEHSLDFLAKQNKLTTWSPTKSIPLLPPLEPLVPSTLPSLIGDLALGTNSSLHPTTTTTNLPCLFPNNVPSLSTTSFSYHSVSQSSVPLFSDPNFVFLPTSKTNKSDFIKNDASLSSALHFTSEPKNQISSKNKIQNLPSSGSSNTLKSSIHSDMFYNCSQNKTNLLPPENQFDNVFTTQGNNKTHPMQNDGFRCKKHSFSSNSKDILDNEHDIKSEKVSSTKILQGYESYAVTKENFKKNVEVTFPTNQCYYPNVSTGHSTSSSFLSVSQLVDSVKSKTDLSNYKERKMTTNKSVMSNKDNLNQFTKEPTENKTNYSAEALLSNPQKNGHKLLEPSSTPQTQCFQNKTTEKKGRYKRKKTDNGKHAKALSNCNFVPGYTPFTNSASMYNIPSSNNVYYTTANHYDMSAYQPPVSSLCSPVIPTTYIGSTAPSGSVFNSAISSNLPYHNPYYINTSASSTSTDHLYVPNKNKFPEKSDMYAISLSDNTPLTSSATIKTLYLDSTSCTVNQTGTSQSFMSSMKPNHFPKVSTYPETDLQSNSQPYAFNDKRQRNSNYQNDVGTRNLSYTSQNYDVKIHHFASESFQDKSTFGHALVASSASATTSTASITYFPSSHYQNFDASGKNIFVTSNHTTSFKSTPVSSAMYSIAPSWHSSICPQITNVNSTLTPPSVATSPFPTYSLTPATTTSSTSSFPRYPSATLSTRPLQSFGSYSSPLADTITSSVPEHSVPKYSSTAVFPTPNSVPLYSKLPYTTSSVPKYSSPTVNAITPSSVPGHSFPRNSVSIASSTVSSYAFTGNAAVVSTSCLTVNPTQTKSSISIFTASSSLPSNSFPRYSSSLVSTISSPSIKYSQGPKTQSSVLELPSSTYPTSITSGSSSFGNPPFESFMKKSSTSSFVTSSASSLPTNSFPRYSSSLVSTTSSSSIKYSQGPNTQTSLLELPSSTYSTSITSGSSSFGNPPFESFMKKSSTSSFVNSSASSLPTNSFPRYSSSLVSSASASNIKYSQGPNTQSSVLELPSSTYSTSVTSASSSFSNPPFESFMKKSSTSSFVNSSASVSSHNSMSSKTSQVTSNVTKVPLVSSALPVASSKLSNSCSTASLLCDQSVEFPNSHPNFTPMTNLFSNPTSSNSKSLPNSLSHTSSAISSLPYTPTTFSYSNSIVPNIPYVSSSAHTTAVSYSMPSYPNSSLAPTVSRAPFLSSATSFSNPIGSSYSTATMCTPVSSSVTNFNLSTIFPEINDMHQSGGPMYANYQRLKPNESEDRC